MRQETPISVNAVEVETKDVGTVERGGVQGNREGGRHQPVVRVKEEEVIAAGVCDPEVASRVLASVRLSEKVDVEVVLGQNFRQVRPVGDIRPVIYHDNLGADADA